MKSIGRWVKAITISLARLSGRSGQKLVDLSLEPAFWGSCRTFLRTSLRAELGCPLSLHAGQPWLSPAGTLALREDRVLSRASRGALKKDGSLDPQTLRVFSP